MRRGLILGALVVGLVATVCATCPAGTVWNLADDWSNVSNPNGPWTLTSHRSAYPNGDPYESNIADWDPDSSNIFGSEQSAWADGAYPQQGHAPMWFKRECDTTILDVPIGVVGAHTPTSSIFSVDWTSTINGTADVSGTVWHALRSGAHLNRYAVWWILHNGDKIAEGNVNNTHTLSSPNDLLDGAIDPDGLRGILIEEGDVISLAFFSPQTHGVFVGLEFEVEATAVPLPPAALAGFGLLGLLGVVRRLRRRKK